MITNLQTIIDRRKREGKRDLTEIEQSEIITTGYYDEEKYLDEGPRK